MIKGEIDTFYFIFKFTIENIKDSINSEFIFTPSAILELRFHCSLH